MAGTSAVTRVAGRSRVRLRPAEQRRDRDGWVIGRPETGDFISVPDVAHRVITLLGEGRTVDEVAARLRAETGTRFAVADFVAALDELGFVAAVDDRVREDHADARPSLPWLRPGHVRWLLHPLAPVVVAGFAVAAVVMLALHPALLPSYRVLVWSDRQPAWCSPSTPPSRGRSSCSTNSRTWPPPGRRARPPGSPSAPGCSSSPPRPT